jgi:bifunctional UDP-N-acetylglucosamine pyrophosphorylase/glucosamine-1-phosphate N-acetyltransferase
MDLRVVILAAGQGTRMKSPLPKVMHPLCGKPMILFAVETAAALSREKPILVVGYGAQAVRAAAGERAEYVDQPQLLGTADALKRAEPALKRHTGDILVFYGDCPLLRPETFQPLISAGLAGSSPLGILTGTMPDVRGLGRVVRDSAARVVRVVEEADATAEQKSIREINQGGYLFRADWLWPALAKVSKSPKGEYYLTDLIALAAQEGGVTAVSADEPEDWITVNTRAQLSDAEAALRRRINRRWMDAGVGMQDPATVYLSCEARIGEGTLILPNTHLDGATVVGKDCVVGPNTILRAGAIGDRSRVEASVVENSTVEEDCTVGPFSHLRSKSHLERGVHMGNYSEAKNSRLGAGAKMGHFSYLGDATVGKNANIGAGTITCNYDGRQKHPTEIGEDAFIGSDTMLVAPVKIGKRARTGAGSVVTHDVPDDTLAVGVPARQVRKIPPEEKQHG